MWIKTAPARENAINLVTISSCYVFVKKIQQEKTNNNTAWGSIVSEFPYFSRGTSGKEIVVKFEIIVLDSIVMPFLYSFSA